MHVTCKLRYLLYAFVYISGMSIKSSGLFEGKKGNTKRAASGTTLTGNRGFITLSSLSIRRASDSNGKHAFMVALGSEGSDSLLLSRCKNFQCDDNLGFDDKKAHMKAVHFATSTDAIPMFRAFVLGDCCGLGYGSGAVTNESILQLGDDIDERISEQRRSQGEEACKAVSFVCLRKNVRAGLIFAITLVRLESRQHRSISFQMQRRHDLEEDDHVNKEEEVLTKAFNFLRSAAFKIWSKDGSNRASGKGDQCGWHGRERGLKHPFSFIGIEDGEKVDCCCGKNRSKGLMVVCEKCGVWEHAECLGYRFNSQIPADYICSTCLRAQNEEVIFIRLDEQGRHQMQWSDDLKEIGTQENATVCCVCGCEDNEDFECMTNPCSCSGGLAIAHPNCVKSVLEDVTLKEHGNERAAFQCPLCGGQGSVIWRHDGTPDSSQAGKTSPPKPVLVKRNTRRSLNSKHSFRGAKRLRSALVHPRMEGKNDLSEESALSSVLKHEGERQAIPSGEKMNIQPAELLKSEISASRKKFADAAVTVPIKKRRIQLMEAVSSPSPPPRSPSPALQGDDVVDHDDTAEELARNTNGEMQNLRLSEILESSFDGEADGTTSKRLKAESSDRETELNQEQPCQFADGDLEKSEVNLELTVAQLNPVLEEIEATCMKEPEAFKVQLDIEACKDLSKITEPDNDGGLSSTLEKRKELQPSQVLGTSSCSLEMLQVDAGHGISPVWDFSSEMDCKYQIPEDSKHNQELQRSVGGPTNSSATGDEPQAHSNMIDATRALKGKHGMMHGLNIAEQQSSSNQLSYGSGYANASLCNRDDRSHWDLNMEMEAWEQPCTKVSCVELSSSKVHSHPHQDCEYICLLTNKEVTTGRSDVADNLVSEGTEEKPGNELKTSLEILPDGKGLSGSNLLEADHVAAEKEVFKSKVFSQPRLFSGQRHCYEEEKLENGISSDFMKLTNSLTSITSSVDKSLNTNALCDERELENTTGIMEDDTKYQLPAAMDFITSIAVDALEPVSEHIPNGANLASTLKMKTAHTETIKSMKIDVMQHNNCAGPSLEIATKRNGCKTLSSQNYQTKDVNRDSTDADTTGEKAVKIGEKSESIEVDAMVEGVQGADSLRQSIGDGDDSQWKLSKMRLADWDEGADYDLEREYVDYGDSENDVEQGHGDGETYNLEIDDVPSVGLQEQEDLGDDDIDNHDDIQKYAEEGQIIPSVDSADGKKLDSGSGGQYNLNTELEIRNNSAGANLQTNALDGEESVHIHDMQTKSEELADSRKIVMKFKEGGKDSELKGSDDLSSSKKVSAVRTKSSGWDQLPEGFEKAEDALRAVKENSAKIGRGAFRGGFLSGQRRGSPFAINAGLGRRGRMDVFGRSSFANQYLFPMDENSTSDFTSSRRSGLGRNRGRSGSPFVLTERSRLDLWSDDYGGPLGPWNTKRHPSPSRFREASNFGQHGQANAAAIAAAKLESSGFLVAPDGTITKAGSANNALRGSPRSYSGGDCRRSGMMMNSGRGALVRGEMNLGRKVGSGPGRGFEFDRDNISMNMIAGPGVSGRPRLNSREGIDPYRFAPHSVKNSVREPSFSRSIQDHSEKWNRRDRHFSLASSKPNRISPRSYRRSSSTSRSRSPGLRTPPRSGNGGIGVLPRRSLSPIHVRSAVKGDSQESSPSGRCSAPAMPKLPFPQPPSQGQHSPPAGLRRFSDRKEGDRRYSGLEQTTALQSHKTPPRRLPSHIEQNLITSDDPDQQSLSSLQDSMADRLKSAYTVEHISCSGPGRNLASMESFGKVNSEVQLLSEDEYVDSSAWKGESSRQRSRDDFRLDKNVKVWKLDGSFYKAKWEKDDSRFELIKSRRDGRAGNHFKYSSSKEVDDEVAPRRRRAPS